MKFVLFLVVILFLPMGTTQAQESAEKFVIQSGDTLSKILSDRFTVAEVTALARELKSKEPAFVLKTGMSGERSEYAVAIDITPDKTALFHMENDEPKLTVLEFQHTDITTVISGTIRTNLFDAVREIGETPELAANIARMYEWEFDFFRDIRAGDTFTVLVEKRFIRDRYVGYGQILAAEFTVRGKKHQAYYFGDGKQFGYYDENGRSLKRGFLRVPLSYSRISSRFSGGRMHPVLGVNRPHNGVDFAAPTGTPIMATANGTITRMTYTNNNGNFIEIRHTNGYETMYLHMSRFNNRLRVGSQVTQGQVIGYVGSTGLSTGPHLCYRIKHKGKWINPLTFIAESPKLDESHKGDFMEIAATRYKLLNISHAYASLYRAAPMP